MVGVGSWYGRSRRKAARCSKRVAGVGRSRRVTARSSKRVAGVSRSRREAARCSKRVADVGRSRRVVARRSMQVADVCRSRKETTRCSMRVANCHVICHWEERNKKFPLPLHVWIDRPQRLTVKRGIRNVVQFLAAEVTNPGQNESQEMFTLCDRTDKEGNIEVSIVARMNSMTGGGRRKRPNDWPEP